MRIREKLSMLAMGWALVRPEKYTEEVNELCTAKGFDDEKVVMSQPSGLGHMCIPRALWHHPEVEAEINYVSGRSIGPFAPINLRSHQHAPVDAMCAHLTAFLGGVLQAGVGTGKTVMGLEIARRLGKSTLILVHTSLLFDQWQERIKNFLPDAKVGIIRKDKCDSGEDFDFVIGMISSMSRIDYPLKTLHSFGTVIVDEVHHTSALTWRGVLVKTAAKFRLGLTATPERGDRLEQIYMAHIGPIAHSLEYRDLTPTIFPAMFKCGLRIESYIDAWSDDAMLPPKLLSALAVQKRRNLFISRFIAKARFDRRKIMVITDRTSQIDCLLEIFEDPTWRARLNGGTIARCDGKVRGKKKRAEALEADIILTTYKLAGEGLDLPGLEILILATPRANVTQPVGRLLRGGDKKPPLVVDIVDCDIEELRDYWNRRYVRYCNMHAKFYGKRS